MVKTIHLTTKAHNPEYSGSQRYTKEQLKPGTAQISIISWEI